MLQSPQMESKWHDAPYCCIKGISLHLLLSWAHGSIHHHLLHPPFWRPSHLKSAVPRWQDKASAPLPAMIWSSWGRRRSVSSKWVGCSPLYCCYAAVMWREITGGVGGLRCTLPIVPQLCGTVLFHLSRLGLPVQTKNSALGDVTHWVCVCRTLCIGANIQCTKSVKVQILSGGKYSFTPYVDWFPGPVSLHHLPEAQSQTEHQLKQSFTGFFYSYLAKVWIQGDKKKNLCENGWNMEPANRRRIWMHSESLEPRRNYDAV